MATRLFLASLSALVFMAVASASASAKEEKVSLNDVPHAVTAAVSKRFPDAKLVSAEKEEEDGKLIFELAIKDKGQSIDVSVFENGNLHEIERQIRKQQLPKAVANTLTRKYPDATLKIAEEVILVKDGKEVLEGYELKVASGKKTTEIKIAPDGAVKKVEEQDADQGDDDEAGKEKND